MKVNEFFDKVVVINLDRREDRMTKISATLDALGIKFERFAAIDSKEINSTGIQACAKSHYKVIEMAIAQGLNNLLVLEDDGIFVDDFLERFESLDIPDDWDMIYLQSACLCSHDKNAGFKKIYHCLTTGAVGINNTIFQDLLEINDQQSHVDENYAKLHRSHKVYAVDPSMVTQGLDYSDIVGQWHDPSYLF